MTPYSRTSPVMRPRRRRGHVGNGKRGETAAASPSDVRWGLCPTDDGCSWLIGAAPQKKGIAPGTSGPQAEGLRPSGHQTAGPRSLFGFDEPSFFVEIIYFRKQAFSEQ